jgi:hypothetical protein
MNGPRALPAYVLESCVNPGTENREFPLPRDVTWL